MTVEWGLLFAADNNLQPLANETRDMGWFPFIAGNMERLVKLILS